MQSAFSVNGGFKSVPYTCAAAQGDKLFKNIQCLHLLLGLRRQENRVFEFKRKKNESQSRNNDYKYFWKQRKQNIQ